MSEIHITPLSSTQVDVQGEYNLSNQTLHTAIQLVDRCLLINPAIQTNFIQLLGITSASPPPNFSFHSPSAFLVPLPLRISRSTSSLHAKGVKSSHSCPRHRCLFISSKFCEVLHPLVREMVWVCDNSYTLNQVPPPHTHTLPSSITPSLCFSISKPMIRLPPCPPLCRRVG